MEFQTQNNYKEFGMIYLLYFFAAILVYLSFQSLRGGIHYLDYFKRESAKTKSNYTPFASIIAPCRGFDQDLKENITALYRQNYPAYEIVFAVDDARDEAVSVIESAWKSVATNAGSKLVVAGKAVECGQKVHNLRQSVREVSDEAEIFVFVDSDARPSSDWLQNLIAPLENKEIGATTGYRWFVSKKGNFASQLRAVWNASVASALSENREKNFCWGGSTAIRRETFERINMHEHWRGVLSDDFAVTRVLRKNNLPIYFVPQCLTASIEDCSLPELLEFTTRQMKITRVYAAHLWKSSLVGGAIFTTVFYSLFILIVWRAFKGDSFWLPLAFLLLIFVLGAAKSWLRLKAVKLILTNYERELKKSFWAQIFLFPLAPPIFLYNTICAAFSRQIVWRGIKYELKSPTETVIVSQNETTGELANAE